MLRAKVAEPREESTEVDVEQALLSRCDSGSPLVIVRLYVRMYTATTV